MVSDIAGYDELEQLARRGRWLVISTVAGSGAGHIGGPLSAMEILIALYFRVMKIRPREPNWPQRDRFVLSKGHSAIGLYSVLALRGFFPIEELETFDKAQSRLQGHPDMTRLPVLEASTGSLGQGLSVGLGFALGARLRGDRFHTFALIGDGELQEGMIWEAVHTAARYRLGNLTAILDWNGLQQFGWERRADEPNRGDRRDPWADVDLRATFEPLGWDVLETDGHDYAALIPTLEEARRRGRGDRPTIVLARTVKGKGVRLTEGRYEWHSRVPTTEELESVAMELGMRSALS
jgi:transketolase